MGVPLLKLGSQQTGLRLPVETKDPKGRTTSPFVLGTPDMKPPAPQVKVPQGRSTSLLQWGSPTVGGPKALPLTSLHRQTPSKGDTVCLALGDRAMSPVRAVCPGMAPEKGPCSCPHTPGSLVPSSACLWGRRASPSQTSLPKAAQAAATTSSLAVWPLRLADSQAQGPSPCRSFSRLLGCPHPPSIHPPSRV